MSADSAAAQPATPDSLIEQCLSGDQAAWETIVRQNWRKVFNVAYKFVGKHDEAEDLTQDIFLKIFKALATFDRRANFQTWIISISRNLCIDHYRSVRKERQTIARDVDTGDLQPASSERGPHAVAEHQDLRAMLRQARAKDGQQALVQEARERAQWSAQLFQEGVAVIEAGARLTPLGRAVLEDCKAAVEALNTSMARAD